MRVYWGLLGARSQGRAVTDGEMSGAPPLWGRESTLWLLERFGVDPAGVMKLGRAGFGGVPQYLIHLILSNLFLVFYGCLFSSPQLDDFFLQLKFLEADFYVRK